MQLFTYKKLCTVSIIHYLNICISTIFHYWVNRYAVNNLGHLGPKNKVYGIGHTEKSTY